MIPKRHIDRHVVRTDPRHHTITDPALTNPLPPIITHNNPHFSDFIEILHTKIENPLDKIGGGLRKRVTQPVLFARRDIHTAGYNYVKIFDPTGGRNCSRAYSRQYQAQPGGTEVPSAKTENTDSGSIAEGEISDQREQPAAGSSPDGSDGDNPDTDTGESEVEPLPKDKVFEILKNSRRRQALLYLKENGGDASLGELAEHIAAIENDCSVRAISSSQRKRVYVGLYQCHLPKMDGMHIVDFEKNRGTIKLGANATQLDPYLEETQELARSRIHFGITILSIGLVAVSLLLSAPLGVASLVVLGVLLVVMAVISGLQTYIQG